MPARQIAIDGPAASGKSTVAKMVAEALEGFYVNTGDMYRTVTRAALDHGIDPRREVEALEALLPTLDLHYREAGPGELQLVLNGEPVRQADIRAPEVTECVSYVAKEPAVRQWMKSRQRACCDLGTIVMEGRDIGTVILPDASHKFFLIATPEERARRRLAQADEVAPDATVESVAAQIAERDRIDSSRAVAPLKAAADAVLIQTDKMTPEEVRDVIVARVKGGSENR